MKFPKLPARPEHLMGFFEEGLHSLGAICERSWHDRLEVLAEGDAARLWREDEELFSGEVYLRDTSSNGTPNAQTDVFPCCQLTVRLVEALWRRYLGHSRVCLSPDISTKAASKKILNNLWQ